MNVALVEPAAWSRQRWIVLCALVLAAHVGVTLWLREPPRKERPRTTPIIVHLALTPQLHDRLVELPTLSDPTLFGLPNENSFSGVAWSKFTPLPQRLSEWSEPPNWLTQRVDRLGRAFSQFAATTARSSYLIADKPLPAVTALDVVTPAAAVETQSVLRFDANLAKRRLINPVTLRTQSHSDILTNSVVQVIVDQNGIVVSRRLLAECGSERADQDALAIAGAMRFEPLHRRVDANSERQPLQPTIGKLTFEWRAVSLSATNAPAGSP